MQIKYAKSLNDLAAQLNVTKQTLLDWRKKHPDDYPSKIEGVGYDVEDFRVWAKSKSLGMHNGKKNAYAGTAIIDGRQYTWDDVRIGKALTEIRRNQIRIDKETGKTVTVEQSIRAFNLAVTEVIRKKDLFVKRAAPRLVGLEDVVDIRSILESELDTLFYALSNFDFKPDKPKIGQDDEDEEEEEYNDELEGEEDDE